MQHAEILALAGLRIDGRKPTDVRKLHHKIGVVSGTAADGSVYFEQGLNKVLVMVHGPQEPLNRSGVGGGGELVDKCNIDCRIINAPTSGLERKRRRAGGSDRRTQELENIVQQTMRGVVMLDQYPRSEIIIVVHVLETDGSIICTILNAVCMACMDAGIMMSDMVVSCSAGLVRQDMCIDLSQLEQQAGGAYLPMVMKAKSEEIIWLQMDSRLSVDNLEAAMNVGVDGCRMLREYMDSSMRAYLSDVSRNLQVV